MGGDVDVVRPHNLCEKALGSSLLCNEGSRTEQRSDIPSLADEILFVCEPKETAATRASHRKHACLTGRIPCLARQWRQTRDRRYRPIVRERVTCWPQELEWNEMERAVRPHTQMVISVACPSGKYLFGECQPALEFTTS